MRIGALKTFASWVVSGSGDKALNRLYRANTCLMEPVTYRVQKGGELVIDVKGRCGCPFERFLDSRG